MWLYFLSFSLDLNLAEFINWKIRGLRRGCQENIRILNLAAFVVSKNFPTTKSADFISKQIRGRSISSRKKEKKKTTAVVNNLFFLTK